MERARNRDPPSSGPPCPERVNVLMQRLRRIEGQARGLQKRLEEGRSFAELLTQLRATRKAMDSLVRALLVEVPRPLQGWGFCGAARGG